MYGFDIGMHVSDNLVAIEKKERAEAQARAAAKAQAQAQIEAQAHTQAAQSAQSQAQAHVQPTHYDQPKPQPLQRPTIIQTHTQPQPHTHHALPNKPKPGHLNLPFNVFQAQMQKSAPGMTRSASANAAVRPVGPNRNMSFPAFPPPFQRPVTPSQTASGISSLAASAYNSPLPSPGQTVPHNNPWFPFPKTDSGTGSKTAVCRCSLSNFPYYMNMAANQP